MRKNWILLLVVIAALSCNNKKNEPAPGTGNRVKDDYRSGQSNTAAPENNTASWSEADVSAFNEQCRETLKDRPGLVDKLCPCLLEKMQGKYASMAEMDRKSTEEEGKSAAEKCMAELGIRNNKEEENNLSSGGWPESEREAFMTQCVKSAMKKNVSRQTATRYCSCMMENLERVRPDVNELSNMSQQDMERLTAPFTKKCQEGN